MTVKDFPEEFLPFLSPTSIIDSDHPEIREYCAKIAGDVKDPVEASVKLYLAVRDGIRYDPYTPFHLPEHYRSSEVLRQGRGFCIPKASLLCALARARGIPCRLGFADVKNHLATKQLIEYWGGDLFPYHAYVELHLEGKWVKATPAFNKELCERHKVLPLEFNGHDDSLFQPYNEERRKFMEYVHFRGIYADVPVDDIVAVWTEFYGREQVESWIKSTCENRAEGARNFELEEVIRE